MEGLYEELRELLPGRLFGQLLLLLPAALLLAMQVFGVINADEHLESRLHLAPWANYFLVAGITLSAVSPFTSALALLAAINYPPKSALILLAIACVTLLGTSVLGCGWTFLTHPTWTQGYPPTR